MARDDTDVSEKPVREQLKKASIGNSEEARKAAEEFKMASSESDVAAEAVTEDAPRLQKKRSFEEVEETQGAAATTGKHHNRKRSRDSTAEDDELNGYKRKTSGERTRDQSLARESGATNGAAKPAVVERAGTPEYAGEKRSEDAVEAIASPKLKRSKLETGSAGNENTDTTIATTKDASTSESAPEPAKVPPTSGFANSSASSPFGSLAGSKSPNSSDQPQTSTSAFASSGFGALAGSSTSGFGAIGKSTGGFGTGGGFGSGGKSPLGANSAKSNEKPATSSFGGALGQQSAFGGASSTSGSGFGSGASGFGGKLGQSSGFGSALGGSSGFGGLGGGAGLSSFASGKSAPLASSSKPVKSFGAPAEEAEEDDDDGGEGDDAGYKSPLHTEADQKDERFYKQDLATGEEDEITQYSARAKLYNFVTLPDGKKEWRERGLGVLKLNVKHLAADEDESEDQKPKARFLMRADGSHRVVLNTPVKKELKFGAPGGGPPTNGLMFFMGTVEGSTGLEMLQLKMRQQFALEMHERITELQEIM